jgi:hypothetical protein
MKKKDDLKFILDTNWVFDGTIDSEHREYVLLSYFQKLNKKLDELKIYPMFTELSLHICNIQSLINSDRIIYTDKTLKSFDDELVITDLKTKDIPELSLTEKDEYKKILKYSHTKLIDYFNITKAFWSVVYDATIVKLRKNKKYLNSNIGYFYYQSSTKLYVWKYTFKITNKEHGIKRATLKLILEEDKEDLTTRQIISKFYKEDTKNGSPIFEIISNDMFPMDETLLPIFKRKVMSYIGQQVKNLEKSKLVKYEF